MADIRINALATTAASTASDDYIAIDGSANGTRKLNAYSPTFGGNLTVSGTGLNALSGSLSVAGQVSTVSNSTLVMDYAAGGDYGRLLAKNSAGTYATAIQTVNPLTVGGALTATGNLTVSGGAITLLDPNVNLQADASNLRFDNYAGKGFLWSIGGSARLNLNSSGNLLLGTTTDAGGKLQIATGANSTLLIGNDATYSGYNQIAFNGVRTNNATLGIIGGATGDDKLYLLAPSGGQLLFQVAAVSQFTVSSGGNGSFVGSISTGTPAGGTSGAWKLGVKVDATTTLDTTKYLQVDIGGTLYKVALVTS